MCGMVIPRVPWKALGNNKSGILLIAAGNSYFINCKVVVLSPKSLHISLSLSLSV